MKRRTVMALVVMATLLALLISGGPGFAGPPTPDMSSMEQDSVGVLEVTNKPNSSEPAFIRGYIPLSNVGVRTGAKPETIALAFVDNYADIFGVTNASQELEVLQSDVDSLGMTHITMHQVYQGVKVYNASIKIHMDAKGEAVVAINNAFVPGINLASVSPQVSSERAQTIAKMALPTGELVSDPELIVYPQGGSAYLAWLVELRDDAIPVRNVYVVNAAEESILDVVERLYEQRYDMNISLKGGDIADLTQPVANGSVSVSTNIPNSRNRQTYSADHGTTLPGTLVRSEGDAATGDQDVDNAHDFAGATYDYYNNTHGRDSYDNQGAAIISTAHYGNHYQNAFWDGSQMVYGDGFAVNDVVAHELTHAVTEHSANLEYNWQSGALNESFSDIFGTMVDRNDWLMGEDLPASALGGREAIRDLSDPTKFGQPAHTDNWVETCSDHEGVHTNSGITNKAYYNIATAISKDKAERIFYRTLTVYLTASASLEEARASALQSAQDLYGSGSNEYAKVEEGFNAVGLDGQWNPPANDCSCAARTAIADDTVYPDQISALEVATTLYQVRSQLLSNSIAGEHYRDLYNQYTGKISFLLVKNARLRQTGGQILKIVTPGLNQLLNGNGDSGTVTHEMVTETTVYLQDMVDEARQNGDEDLAQTIEEELTRLDWDNMVGMTFAEAWDYIQSQIATPIHQVYIPLIFK